MSVFSLQELLTYSKSNHLLSSTYGTLANTYQNKMSFFQSHTILDLTHLQSEHSYKFRIFFCTSTDLPGNRAFLFSHCDTLHLALLNFSVLVLNICPIYHKVLNSSIMLKDICSPSQLTCLCKSHTSSFKYIIQDTNNNVDHM